MIPVILAVSQALMALATIFKIIEKTNGGVMTEVTISTKPEQMAPEDVAALAITSGLNALFNAWLALDKVTNGKIPDWDTLASRNALLQAQIDAEKA